MAEPTIVCPKCQNEIKLNESLAAPLLESTKREYEARLIQKDTDIATRQKELREREESLARQKEALDAQIAEKMKQERAKIASEESKKAKLELAIDLDEKTRKIADLHAVLQVRDQKLAEAQKAQAETIQKQRELDDAKRELDLTVQKRVQEGLAAVRQQGRKDAEDELKLKVAEKEQTITSMQKQIEDLKRRAEQGSQQMQGEVQEVELESLLRARFSRDTIEPVPKGEFGGDALHRVIGPLGQPCGTILWETKRTKSWSDGWLGKLRDDQRAAKAEVCVLVTHALPKEVQDFDFVDNVWVTHPRVAIPVGMMLRQALVELANARQASEGQQTKMELLYSYLTGPRFRQRVQAIVEGFSNMKEDLDKEKKVITKQWAKRDEQIERVMQATVGMYGDMQGIAGRTLQEIEGLEIEALDEGDPL